MSKRLFPQVRLVSALALVAAAGSGCSYFTASKRIDMQPFAENTVTAIGEMRKIEAPPVWIRLRPYFSHPSVLEARASAKPLLELVRGINAYSLQVVSLNESRISDQQKCRELAKFIQGASQTALMKDEDTAQISLTPERQKAILEDVEKREKFIDALQAAEPIVNAVLARGLTLADQVDGAIIRAINAIEVEVQKQYGPMLANRVALLSLQDRAVRNLALSEAIAFGDDAAPEEVKKAVPVLAEYVPSGKKPSAKEQQALVAALSSQSLRIKVALEQIEPEYQAYRESVLELDNLRAKTTENAKLARSVLMIWARSHKNLARGVEVPAMFDLAKIVMSAAGTAAKGVLPF
jgi:hypothetical protein